MIDVVIEGAGRNALSTIVLTSLREAVREMKQLMREAADRGE